MMSSSSEDSVVTENVSYVGLVSDLGAIGSEQATHSLTLDGGQKILLSSNDENLNLNVYLGKRVEVRGGTQATVESGGILMRVSEVTVLDSTEPSSSSESSVSSSKKFCGGIAAFPCDAGQTCVDDPSDSCDPMNGGADCGGMCVTAIMPSSSSLSSSAAMTSSSSSKMSSSKSSSVASSAASVSSSTNSVSQAMEAKIVLMAKQNYGDAALWTQKYCTSHVAFCIPVHKNWFFNSFGATTSNQWHVEFGMEAISNLGDGPISLNLVAGTSASMNATDGQVKVQGNEVIGFKDWKDGHFEIIADSRLQAAVAYMIAHITSYDVQ